MEVPDRFEVRPVGRNRKMSRQTGPRSSLERALDQRLAAAALVSGLMSNSVGSITVVPSMDRTEIL